MIDLKTIDNNLDYETRSDVVRISKELKVSDLIAYVDRSTDEEIASNHTGTGYINEVSVRRDIAALEAIKIILIGRGDAHTPRCAVWYSCEANCDCKDDA